MDDDSAFHHLRQQHKQPHCSWRATAITAIPVLQLNFPCPRLPIRQSASPFESRGISTGIYDSFPLVEIPPAFSTWYSIPRAHCPARCGPYRQHAGARTTHVPAVASRHSSVRTSGPISRDKDAIRGDTLRRHHGVLLGGTGVAGEFPARELGCVETGDRQGGTAAHGQAQQVRAILLLW